MYTEFETAKIFGSCSTLDEVIRAGVAFGYLSSQFGEPAPVYVRELANKRYRNLLNT